MANATQKTRFRFWLWLIAVVGVIVPRRLRADWRQEWEAELRYRETLLSEWARLDWRNKLDLLLRSLGAFRDALLLQPRRLEDEMFQDLRFGARMLLKAPSFMLAAILSLAIGIGATSAIFGVVNGVVLRPLPYREPERLVRLWQNKVIAGVSGIPVSEGNVNVWRKQAQSFETVGVFYSTDSVITGEADPEQIPGARVSHDLLPMLGYQPAIGRHFLPEENRPGAANVVILSHKFWQRRFGGDPAILGRSITLDHTNQYTVIGVMPPEASFPDKSEFWLPEKITANDRHNIRRLSVLARLKPGVTPQMAQMEVSQINSQLKQRIPDDYEGWETELQPLHDSIVGKVRNSLLVLFGAVGFVLLIACANVANLLLARASARQKEMAMRAALGASRLRLIRQLLTESVTLAVLGGVAGLALARLAVKALIALNPPDVPRLAQVNLDGRVLAFTLFTTLLVGIIFGLAPALHSSKPDLNNALKDGAAAGSGGRRWLRRFGFRDLMVVAQTALAVVLLAGAGLLIKSFVKLRQVELGFTPANVVSLTLSPPFSKFPKDYKRADYYRRMTDSLKTMPGVEAVALATGAPTTGAYMNASISIAARTEPDNAEAQRAFVSVVSADYFRAIGNPLKQGRSFTDDDNESSQRVAIINETMARTYFAGMNPIGHRIFFKGEPDKQMEIVGVTVDIKQFGLDQENKPAIYQPSGQHDVSSLKLIVRTSGAPAAIIPALRRRILSEDKFTAITRVRTLDELVSDSVAQPRFYTLLLAIFAAIALALAVVGVYSLMAYSVSRRAHEIGVRMALGAEAGMILRLVIGRGLTLILAGVAVGLAGAFALTRLMSGLLFSVSATDPAVFAAISLILIAVALAACVFPARKATRIDPMVALRHD
ncbi:MAG TPA: ABC transporter permease [Blastocatellia bacterium]|nr:ABC transporter permease [Blastocatellia bacterium]